MTTYAHEDLKRILETHRKWLNGEEGGERAVLSGADLSGAVLSGAVLSGAVLRRAVLSGAVLSDAVLSGAVLSDAVLSDADLRRAVLSGAVLSGAVLSDEVILSDGVTWGEYKKDVVPALLVAGGRALTAVATPEVWECHQWSNCPMHTAFGADTLSQVPALHRWQADRFIQFFDAKLIPLSAIRPDLEPAAA